MKILNFWGLNWYFGMQIKTGQNPVSTMAKIQVFSVK